MVGIRRDYSFHPSIFRTFRLPGAAGLCAKSAPERPATPKRREFMSLTFSARFAPNLQQIFKMHLLHPRSTAPTAMHSHAIICRMSMCMKLVGPVMAGEFLLQGTAAEAEEVLKLARSSSANIHAELLRAKATAVLEDQDGPGWTMTCLRSSKFNLF